MSDRKSNHPFHAWVPRPLGIVILLLMFVPPTFSGGAYLSNVNEMQGSLAWWTEDIQLASFFTSIGMCLFPPFMVSFLQMRRTKQTYIACFLLLMVLNAVCAFTTSPAVLLAACLLTGFVRVVVILNCTFTIAPYLTGMDTLSMFTMKEEPSPGIQYLLERKRTFLMPVLYFYILFIAQLSNMLTAWFAFHFRWQDAYLAVICMLMVAVMIVMISMPDEEKEVPSDSPRGERRKAAEMMLMAVALCCMTYVLIYGKTLDWWDSSSIVWAFSLLLMASGTFILLALRRGDCAYLPLGVFGYRNVTMSMLLFLVTMIFNFANSFVMTFARISTSADNVQVSSLSLWAIVGCFAGLVLSLLLIVRKVHFRVLFSSAFLLMAASNAYLYFQYQTEGMFHNLWLPMLLNFTGLLMLYSLVAAWGMKGLPSRYLATFVFLMIWMRNAIAPVVGTSIYSNALYHRQQYYVTRLSQDVDALNRNAWHLPPAVLKGKVMQQAILVAMKNISGTTVVGLTATAFIVLFLPYRRHETT
ncbi:MAG: hypothetical protein ACI3YJ_05685 [Prevotella sp.]